MTASLVSGPVRLGFARSRFSHDGRYATPKQYNLSYMSLVFTALKGELLSQRSLSRTDAVSVEITGSYAVDDNLVQRFKSSTRMIAREWARHAITLDYRHYQPNMQRNICPVIFQRG